MRILDLPHPYLPEHAGGVVLARAVLVLAVAMSLLGACRSGHAPIGADSPPLFRADAIMVSPDGKRVAVVCSPPNQEQWSICFWDTGTGRLREGYGYDARMAWSPVDLPLFANGREHTTTIDLWNFDGGRTIRQLSGHRYPDIFDAAPELLVLTFSPDGQQLASAFDGDSTVTLWRVSDGVPLQVLDLTPQQPLSVSFNSDGRRVAIATDGNAIQLWNTVTGEQVAGGGLDGLRGTRVRFSPDGRWLATIDRHGAEPTIGVWDAQTLLPFRNYAESVIASDLAFSPDGQLLAFSDVVDNSIRLWWPDSDQRATLEGHVESPAAITFSPDGKLLYSVSAREGVLQWDLSSRRLRRRLDLPRPLWP